ncbi:MAG: peptidoglycan-binding protein, partial [Rhodoplanes sp.]
MTKVWTGDSQNRLAKSLVTLIDDIVEKFPGRDNHNDGTIGDVRHQAEGAASDHNPHVRRDGMGIVTALDITHDPSHGFDAQAFADSLREQKEPRIKYVIFNGRIFNSTVHPWEWRDRHKGPGDHSEHVHISVADDPNLYDEPSPWKYDLSHASPGPTPAFPPKLKRGDTGPAVIDLQNLLGITEDGVFGDETEEAVREFQARNNLFVDGIVGSHTWGVLKESLPKLGGGTTEVSLTQATIDEIVKLAANSPLANVKWEDRGRSPPGYIKGMAVTFGQVYAKLKAQDSAARLMAAQNSGNAARDALALYDPQFRAAGIDNSVSGPATLRHLFVLLIGLGMRESSGKYNEGRDMSADNMAADTAEAGLFQMSWNARSASSELPRLFALYSKKPDGFLSIFQEGVKPKETAIIGAGEGAAFQRLCKSCPAFAAEAAAVGLRVLCRHWGPIKRHEAEIRPEADVLLKKVQEVVDTMQPVPQPTPKPSPRPEPSPQPGPQPKPIEGFPIPIPPIGIGTMNPFILIAARVFPEILKAVVGDKAGTITGVLTKVITDVTHANTPEEARDKLNADPEAVAKLQLELATIANDYELARRKAELDLIKEQNEQEIKRQQTQLEALKVRYEEDAKKREADFQGFRAGLEDTKDARASLRAMAAIAGADKWLLRAPPILSYMVTIGFFLVLGRVDGFDQDEAEGERDEGTVIARSLLATKGDALEALEFADG